MKSIIYTRVSTDEQATGHSLGYQEDRLRKYCAEKNIEIAEHFQDDYSAKTFNRPAYKEMIRYIRRHRGQIDQVLVTKWDRFTRAEYPETGRALGTLQDLGVKLIAIEQQLDSDVPESEIMRAIYIAQGHVENRRRGINTHSGMIRAKEEGRWVTTPPLGYKFGRDERNKPILVKSDRAEIVKKIFEEFATGD